MKYFVNTSGNDCLGNCTGWTVERYVNREREIVAQFVGDIYKPEEREFEHAAAKELCEYLNGEIQLAERQHRPALDYALDCLATQQDCAA